MKLPTSIFFGNMACLRILLKYLIFVEKCIFMKLWNLYMPKYGKCCVQNFLGNKTVIKVSPKNFLEKFAKKAQNPPSFCPNRAFLSVFCGKGSIFSWESDKLKKKILSQPGQHYTSSKKNFIHVHTIFRKIFKKIGHMSICAFFR